MEQIMKNLEDPELRKYLAELEKADAKEQAEFARKKCIPQDIPVMAEVDRKPFPLRQKSLAVQHAVSNALGRHR